MKTNHVPSSAEDRAHPSTGQGVAQVRVDGTHAVRVRPRRQREFISSLAVMLVIALTLLLTGQVQSDPQLEIEGYRLEGSWNFTVSPILPPGAPPVTFRALVTFGGGGALIGSNPGRPFASPAHGTWVHVQGHEYAMTSVQYLFEQAGNFLGTFKDRTRIVMVGKDECVGVANVEQHDSSGNLVLSRCARVHATRLEVEPFAPPCEGLEPGM